MKRAALPLAVAGLAYAALVSCHTGVGGHISEPDKVGDPEGRRRGLPHHRAAHLGRGRLRRCTAPRCESSSPTTRRSRRAGPRTAIGPGAICSLRSEGAIRSQEFRLTILALDGRNDLAYVHGAYQMSLIDIPARPEPVGTRASTRRDLEEAAGRELGRWSSTSTTRTFPRRVRRRGCRRLTPPAHDSRGGRRLCGPRGFPTHTSPRPSGGSSCPVLVGAGRRRGRTRWARPGSRHADELKRRSRPAAPGPGTAFRRRGRPARARGGRRRP